MFLRLRGIVYGGMGKVFFWVTFLERRDRMKKRRHILLFLLLCLPLAFSDRGSRNADAALKASGDWMYSVLQDGTVEIQGYTGKVRELRIPETIDGKIVTTVSNVNGIDLYEGSAVESLEIPSGITRISKDAFWLCGNLKTISVSPDNKKYDSRKNCNAVIETATNTLVLGCDGTKIPSEVTKIGENAFKYSAGLERITIPSGVTAIGEEAFYACEKLQSIEIPSGTKSIGPSAFGFCRALKKIAIPNTVKRIGSGAFIFCTNLQSVTIPSSVKRISRETFIYCKNLKKVVISEGVTEIGAEAFVDCEKLKSVRMPSSLKIIRNQAFGACTALRKITIPSGVTKIGWSAFEFCYRLKYITIKSKKLKTVGIDALEDIRKNAVIKVPKGKRKTYRKLFSPRTGYRKTMKIK